jgi:hypothetical protein
MPEAVSGFTYAEPGKPGRYVCTLSFTAGGMQHVFNETCNNPVYGKMVLKDRQAQTEALYRNARALAA